MNRAQRDALEVLARYVRPTESPAVLAAVDLWDRLPKTADGVAVVAGDRVWFWDDGPCDLGADCASLRDGGIDADIGLPCYSTKAALMAALASKGADPAPSA